MTSKGFGEYNHPVSIKIFDDKILRGQPAVEAIFYIITNLITGRMYIGSHKLFKYGEWLDGYYNSSTDEEFISLFWGMKKDIFEYKIVAGGTHQDMKNLENEYGVEHQVHTNPMYYNKAIPNKGVKYPARIEVCQWVVDNLKKGVFDIKDQDGDWILKPILDIKGMDKHQARKYVDPNKNIKDIRQNIKDNNSISKTEPITIFGESKELLLDGNRTFIACENLKQAQGGLKQRVIPDSLIEEINFSEAEIELMAELLNPRDEVSKEPTDDATVYDSLIKHKREYGIEFNSEYNKKYLKAHHYHKKQIEQMPTVAKKMYEVEEEQNEYGSTYIQWEDKEGKDRKDLEKKCRGIEQESIINGKKQVITIIESAGAGKSLFAKIIDIFRKNEDCKRVIIYPWFKDKYIKENWQGSKKTVMTKKGPKVKVKTGTRKNLEDRLSYVIGHMNLGIDVEYHKSYDIIELDYLRPKTSEGDTEV